MRAILALLLLLECFGVVISFCVFDSKKGWWLDCGIRDSYLFRIKDFGGIQANFDLGIGFGDEKGFPNSISKTNQKGGNYLPPPAVYPPPSYESLHHGHRRNSQNETPQRRNDFPYRFEVPPSRTPSTNHYKQTSRNQWPNTRQQTGQSRSSQQRKFLPKPPQYQSSVSKPPQFQKKNSAQITKPPHYSQYQDSQTQTRYQASSSQFPQHKRQIHNPLSHSQQRSNHPQASFASSWQNQANHRQPQQPYQSQQPSYSSNAQGQRRYWQQKQAPWTQNNQRPTPKPSNKYRFLPPSNNFNHRSQNAHRFQHNQMFIPPPPPPPPGLFNQLDRQDLPFPSPPQFDRPFVFHVPTTTTTPAPTIGPAMSQLLNVPSGMTANTDNVPSFAAKKFIVREAPKEFYPPEYEGEESSHKAMIHVEIPRTKFYCEEQKYLPGIYADAMLGCKMFHLCVPSSVGSTLTSYLCPNGTLFDQSILQCNYWYNVDCESSTKDYDANLALALSYRRINAAHLPLQAATNANTLSLLSQNVNQLQVSNPKKLSKRRGRAFDGLVTKPEDGRGDSTDRSRTPSFGVESDIKSENNSTKLYNESVQVVGKNTSLSGLAFLPSDAVLNSKTYFSDKSLRDSIIQIQHKFAMKQKFQEYLNNNINETTAPSLISQPKSHSDEELRKLFSETKSNSLLPS